MPCLPPPSSFSLSTSRARSTVAGHLSRTTSVVQTTNTFIMLRPNPELAAPSLRTIHPFHLISPHFQTSPTPQGQHHIPSQSPKANPSKPYEKAISTLTSKTLSQLYHIEKRKSHWEPCVSIKVLIQHSLNPPTPPKPKKHETKSRKIQSFLAEKGKEKVPYVHLSYPRLSFLPS